MTGRAPAKLLKTPSGEIRIFGDGEDLSHSAAQMFMDMAVDAVKRQGRFSVALSGGSTPRMLYESLAEPEFKQGTPWEHVHLFWGDERMVPPDHTESNYGMVREALLGKITIPETNVHRIRGEAAPEQAANEYEAGLREFFGSGDKGLGDKGARDLGAAGMPRFNLVLLGLGKDGHTASLFPGSRALEESSRLAMVADGGESSVPRVTLTLPVINHAAVAAFLVTGESKRDVVAQVVRHQGKNSGLPSERVRLVDGNLLWFLDEAAAANIV